MYFQDPSLAQFQQRLEQARGTSNLHTLFGVESIPEDTQLRAILDNIPSEVFSPIFKDYFGRLRRHHHLKDYEVESGLLMCVIDGTQYHSSKKVHCTSCLTRQHSSGEISYSHSVLQGAIMHPSKKQVLPVMPQAIQNSDGEKKQDCESKAAKRFVMRLRQAHPRQAFLIGGDGLMSHQPMIETVLEQGMHYLFVAKPGDHRYLFEWIADFARIPSLTIQDNKGRTHQYRWQNQVPLNGQGNAIDVNFIEYRLFNEQGKPTYRNSWVTDLRVKESNVVKLAQAGRCRWKIENECFNTLKNQGYHIEHNYGHGKQHLSLNMYLLTLLAFYFHQIFELTDGQYQACRKAFGSKRNLWEHFRTAIRLMLFPSWEVLADVMLNTDDYQTSFQKS